MAGPRAPARAAGEEVRPDAKNNWINLTHNDFEELLPVASTGARSAEKQSQEKAVFKLFSLGVNTARDEWLYDFDKDVVEAKVKCFTDTYNDEQKRWVQNGRPKNTGAWVSRSIKWTTELEGHLKRGTSLAFCDAAVRTAAYRPFVKRWNYFDSVVTHRPSQQNQIFPLHTTLPNTCIVFTDPTGMKPWLTCATNQLPDVHFVGAAALAVCMPRWRYDEEGQPIDNITDWALKQFRDRYKAEPSSVAARHLLTREGTPQRSPQGEGQVGGAVSAGAAGKAKQRAISKQAIFHYVYAVLHDPLYREKYAQNLKREFPRIPFYDDFWQWAAWGEQLMALHLGYETVAPWPLARTDIPDEKARLNGGTPKAMLKADKDTGRIALDSETTLAGVPAEAWTYKLGNRSALERVLDQYKEKKPKDPTIRAKFDTYRFADYKPHVIDLLARVTRVSVETQAIVAAMREAAR